MMVYKIIKDNIGIYKKECVKAVVFALIECFFISLVPLFTGKLMDLGVGNSNVKAIFIYSLLVLFSSILYLYLGIVSIKYTIRATYGFTKNLRERIFNKIIDLSFKGQNKFTTGELMNRCTMDIMSISNCFIIMIRYALVAILILFLSIILVLQIDINVSKAFGYVYPSVIIIMVFLSIFTLSLFMKALKLGDNLNNSLIESIDAIKLVKCLNKENYEMEKFEKVNDNYFKSNTKANILLGLNTPISDIARYGVTLLIAWLGAKSIILSNNDPNIGFTTGNLTSLMTYAGLLYVGINQIAMVGIVFASSRISVKRVNEVLNTEPEFTNEDSDVKLNDGSIEFKNVSFSYFGKDDKCALRDISFKINSGETVGIFGKTSSGKTTIVNLIPKFYDVLNGEVLVSGKNVKEYSTVTLRKEIGFVFQKTNLFMNTISENVKMFNADISDSDVYEACEIADANIFINEKKDKFDEKVSEDGMNLSGGQRQRLAIARAVARKPKILILDDSFSALDSKTAIKIRKNLKEKLKGTTLIIISDRIASLSDVDKVIYIDNGKIIKVGKYDEIFEKL